MIGLWLDLQKLTKKQFEAEIAKLSAAANSLLDQRATDTARASSSPEPAPSGDRPAERVARILTSKAKFSEYEAASRLIDALRTLGINAGSLPPVQHKRLSVWLEDVMRDIPAALVMNAAQQVAQAAKNS